MTRLALLALVGVVCLVPAARADDEPRKVAKPGETGIEVKLTDDSVIKLTLLDSAVEFATPHGKLTIPVNEIRRVELGLRIPDDIATIIKAAAADPGNLTSYQQPQHIGKTFVFKVTGRADGSLWGTGTYTLDSTLSMAAVHAGALKIGQTGNVKVTILPAMAGFIGSTQNGITSQP